MKCRVTEVALEAVPVTTRLPFRFGAVTMTESEVLTARVRIEGDHGVTEGAAADLLVPKWFDKNPDTSIDQDRSALRAAVRDAGKGFCDTAADTVFGLWSAVYRQRVHALPFEDPRRMVHGFGVAMVERAVMDAACRAAETSYFRAWQADLFGFRPGEFVSELEGFDLADALPEQPLSEVAVRHTVGMLDPLRAADIAPEARLDDGLPQALEEDVAAYGLSWFKVKIGQGPVPDRERLLALARFFAGADVRFTLDGNEQYPDLATLAVLLDGLGQSDDGRWFLDRLSFIEQPIHRRATFDPDTNAAVARVTEHAPLILDEADSSVEAFPKALELGYRGVSVKNCKGVFRAMINRGLCALHDGAFQSAEDLTNLPVLPLHQDLCTVATLGLPHVERNGHHYFCGAQHLPRADRRELLEQHPGLYRGDDDNAFLRIENGRLDLCSLQGVGFG